MAARERPRVGTCIFHDLGDGVREGCCRRWTEEKVAQDLEQEKVTPRPFCDHVWSIQRDGVQVPPYCVRCGKVQG